VTLSVAVLKLRHGYKINVYDKIMIEDQKKENI